MTCFTRPLSRADLLNNYRRTEASGASIIGISSLNSLSAAGHAWAYNKVYTSTLYKNHINEYRRGNNYVMFTASYVHRNNLRVNWSIGSIVFFFEHEFNNKVQHLVLIDVARTNDTTDYDKMIPLVVLNNENLHTYAVCRFEDIVASVGLVRCSATNKRKFKAISHHIFKHDLDNSAGALNRF